MSKSNALVSVVIPAYNAEETICAAVESALAQSYPEVEVVVVDDGSTDGTAEVLSSFGSRILLKRQDNQERAAARNTGTALASGEWINFLDADDELLPDKLAVQMGLAAHEETAAIWYAQVQARDGSGRAKGVLGKGSAGVHDVFRRLVLENIVPIQSALVRRSCLQAVGGFRKELTHLEDWDLWLRLAARYPFGFQSTIVANYLQSSTRELAGKAARFSLYETTSKIIKEALVEKLSLEDPLAKRAMAKAYFSEARFALLSGESRTAARRYCSSASSDLGTFAKCHVDSLSLALKYARG